MTSLEQGSLKDRRFASFVPGQVLLLAEHPRDLEAAKVLASVQEGRLIRTNDDLMRAKYDERQVITFTRRENSAFSLIRANLTSGEDEPDSVIRITNTLNKELEAGSDDAPNDVRLSVASPNWLAGGAPYVATGGPGARPVSSGRLRQRARHEFTINALSQSGEEAAGKGVVVAILDTAPSAKELAKAYASPRLQHHPLLQRMLGANGMFDISPTSERLTVSYLDNPDPDWEDYRFYSHDYVMSDHGLFVAGIINTIAPAAKLHLIEVLNPYGVGTLESVIGGLRLISDLYDDTTLLVVNCSLTIQIPLPGQPVGELQWPDLINNSPLLAKMGLLAQWPCDELYARGARVVAAAGNDGMVLNEEEGETQSPKTTRPQARYPAAFERVIGVGALNADMEPADYSNYSDVPEHDGLVTYGGDADRVSGAVETDADDGVLGVYIGKFPNGVRSTNGWARWAGTSFAAPVVSGTLAALASQTNDVGLAATDLLNIAAGGTTTTSIGQVLTAKQG